MAPARPEPIIRTAGRRIPLSRRNALLLGGLGAAATAAGGAGLWGSLASRPPSPTAPVTGVELSQPSELRSTGGRLEARLEAGPGRMQLAGRRASAVGYNGSIPGPTIRVRAGDVLSVRLVNNLDQPTNLHVHGLHVSPEGAGDNVFITVNPGASFSYEYRIPLDHPPGAYWYHPHHHGTVADQIFSGLFGAIIVEDPVPDPATTERLLVISDTTLDGAGNVVRASQMDRMLGREGELILVNGQSNPEFTAKPGERERWRIINACVARYLHLRLDGQKLQLLGMDSGRYHTAPRAEELLLAPGNRADLLVTAVAGDSSLSALYYDRGNMAGMMGQAAGPLQTSQPRTVGTALATLRVAAARTDTTVAAGSVEEWILANPGPMDHPFHLHVWPMQLIEVGGRALERPEWRDVVNVPAHGRVKVRVAFKDFAGRSVYHCHILDHEDLGMMGVIEVR